MLLSNRNGSDLTQVALSHVDSESFLRCSERLVATFDPTAIVQMLEVSEKVAASIDLLGHFREVSDCFVTHVRSLPSDISTSLKAIDMFRQVLEKFAAKTS